MLRQHIIVGRDSEIAPTEHPLCESTPNARMAFGQINAECTFGIQREGTPIPDYF